MAEAAALIAIDSSLLIYAHRARTTEHDRARRALERAANSDAGWGISQGSITEFWSVVTHPAAEGRPSRPAEARAFVSALVRDGGAHLWQPGEGFADRLLRWAEDLRVIGPRIFDLQIALTAFEHGAREIWTHDREFVSIPGLRVRDPLTTAT